MIDPNQLTECLQALMQPNTEIVKQATDYLNNTARNLKGYCSSLLNMTIDENQSIHLRQLAVTTLGQEIKHNYSNVKDSVIPEEEKEFLRNRICHSIIVCSSSKPLKKMLQQIFYKMVSTDFPLKWPNMLNNVIEFLKSTTQTTELYGVLSCVKTILECFEFVSIANVKKDTLNTLVSNLFPF